MRVTYNQVINEFNSFGANHKGIAQFEAKRISEFTGDDYDYPLMWVDTPQRIRLKDDQVIITIPIYFVDLLRNDSNNIKIMSDTLKLCADFIAYYNDYEDIVGFLMTDESDAEEVVDEYDDNVMGHKLIVTIEICNERDTNQVPI